MSIPSPNAGGKNDGLADGNRRPDAIRPAPSHAECARIVNVANEARFAETSLARIVPILADERRPATLAGLMFSPSVPGTACRRAHDITFY